MRRHLLACGLIAILSFACHRASASALVAVSTTTGTTTTTNAQPVLAPVPTLANLRAFTAPSACAQHPGLPTCADALSHGLVLFAWTCTGCNPGWSVEFVINGVATPSYNVAGRGDMTLAPSKLLALSVRQGQFQQSDCVAIRTYNPANPAQNATSNTACLSSALTARAVAPVGPVAPAGPIGPTTAQSASTQSNPAMGGANTGLSHTTIVDPNFVPAPSGMGITHDTPTCSAHGGFGGGLACTAGLQAGLLALVWNCPSCKVDGYRLYRVDGGRHDLQPSNGAYGNDATVTLALLSPPSDGFNGKCYAATAYKGSNESALSNWACAGSSSTATTVTLSPSNLLHWMRERDLRTGTIGYTDPPKDFYDGTADVGYADHYGENPFGDIYEDQVNRTGVLFDLSSLAGHPISKAILKLSALSSWHDYDCASWDCHWHLSSQSPMACVSIVDLATDHWWQNNDLSSSVSYISPGDFMGPDFGIDVTSAVAKWTGNTAPPPNFGFVLRGDDENDQWHGNANHVCLTQLQSISLVVTYY